LARAFFLARTFFFAGAFFLADAFFLAAPPFAAFFVFAFVDAVFFAARRGRPAPCWLGAGPVVLVLRAGAPAGAGEAPGGPPAEAVPSQNLISASSSP